MSESEKPGSVVSQIETREVTITITTRATRKQAHMMVDAVNQVVEQVSKHLGIDADVGASAPVSTAKGSPDPSVGPCTCAKCTLVRALADKLGITLSEPGSPSPSADEDPDPVVNSIPARGPWGAS